MCCWEQLILFMINQSQSQVSDSSAPTSAEAKSYAKIERALLGNAFPNEERDHSVVLTEDLSAYNSAEEGTLQEGLSPQRSWWLRTFGPVKPGSLRSSVIALMAIAIGSGMLAMPSNPAEVGLVLSVLVMVVTAVTARYTMSFLMKLAFEHQIKSYSQLVEYSLGKFAKSLYDFNTFCYVYGSAICYQIIIHSFLWQAMVRFGIDESLKRTVILIVGAAFCCLNTPICFLRNVYQLRYFSYLQICLIITLTLSIVVEFFLTLEPKEIANDIKWWDLNLGIFSCYANTLFIFVTHQLIFPIRVELQRPNMRRMNKIFNRAIFFESIIYMSVMLFGYLTWFQETKPIIFDNYTSVYFTVGKVLMSTTLFFNTSTNQILARNNFLCLVSKEDSKPWFIGTVLSLTISSAVIAVAYPQAKSTFGLMGGFFGLNLVSVFPAFIYYKLKKGQPQSKGFYVFAVISTIIGYTGAIMSQFQN